MSTKVIMFEAEDDRTGKIRLGGGRKVSCCGLVERSYGELGTAAQANREEKKACAPYSAIVALRDRSHPPPKFHSVVDNKN
jgi:hypothetical protein